MWGRSFPPGLERPCTKPGGNITTASLRVKAWREANPEKYEAQLARARERYHRSPRRKRDQSKSAYQRKADYLDQLKLERGCAECGFNENPAALQFHHRDPATKKAPVTTIAANGSWAAMEEEIAKCDVLCANCHAIHHYSRG